MRPQAHAPITLHLDGPRPTLDGFIYFWWKYIRGFDGAEHCARAFIGPYSKRVTKAMAIGGPYAMDEASGFSHVYLCGVSMSGYRHNFHLGMRPAAGARAVATTYNGFTVTVEGAEALAIPALPARFRGLGPKYTSCRNYQFGIEYLEGRTVEQLRLG